LPRAALCHSSRSAPRPVRHGCRVLAQRLEPLKLVEILIEGVAVRPLDARGVVRLVVPELNRVAVLRLALDAPHAVERPAHPAAHKAADQDSGLPRHAHGRPVELLSQGAGRPGL
jgi:hypothetical protein